MALAEREACDCSPLPVFRVTLSDVVIFWSLGLIQLWYSKLISAYPTAIKIPSSIQEEIWSQCWKFNTFTYFQYNLIL